MNSSISFSLPLLNRSFRRIRGKDGGFTQVELAVVLLVIAILTGAAMLGYQSFQNAGRISALNTQIGKLINVAQGYGQGNAAAGNGVYTGLTQYVSNGYSATSASLLPTNYTTNGIQNPYGGYGSLSTSSDPNRFNVIETGLPPDVCTTQIAPPYNIHGTASCSGGVLTIEMY